jgi:hypothetical protein
MVDHTEIKSTVSNVITERPEHLQDLDEDRESVIQYYVERAQTRIGDSVSRIRIKQYVLAEIGNRRSDAE